MQPHKDLIKRLIGLPGDHISYINKVLYINGKKAAQQFINYTKGYPCAQQLFFNRLANNAVVTKHHIALSSLTNNALHALYTGAYANNHSFPHLQKLLSLGY